MATFPTGLYAHTTLVDNVDDVLASHPNTLGGEIEALETKVGIDSSAVTSSIDYFLKHASGAYRTHFHDGSSDDGATLDWDTCWADAIHSHQSNAEGGTLDIINATTSTLTVARGGTGGTDASTARTNLGLGSIATQSSSSVSITGGSVTGITDIAIADGGTASSTAAGAYTNIVVPKVYDSGWFAVSTGVLYTKTHNLGTTAVISCLYYSDQSDGSGDVVQVSGGWMADGAVQVAMQGGIVDLTTTQVMMGGNAACLVKYYDKDFTIQTRSTGYFRILMLALV